MYRNFLIIAALGAVLAAACAPQDGTDNTYTDDTTRFGVEDLAEIAFTTDGIGYMVFEAVRLIEVDSPSTCQLSSTALSLALDEEVSEDVCWNTNDRSVFQVSEDDGDYWLVVGDFDNEPAYVFYERPTYDVYAAGDFDDVWDKYDGELCQ